MRLWVRARERGWCSVIGAIGMDLLVLLLGSRMLKRPALARRL